MAKYKVFVSVNNLTGTQMYKSISVDLTHERCEMVDRTIEEAKEHFGTNVLLTTLILETAE